MLRSRKPILVNYVSVPLEVSFYCEICLLRHTFSCRLITDLFWHKALPAFYNSCLIFVLPEALPIDFKMIWRYFWIGFHMKFSFLGLNYTESIRLVMLNLKKCVYFLCLLVIAVLLQYLKKSVCCLQAGWSSVYSLGGCFQISYLCRITVTTNVIDFAPNSHISLCGSNRQKSVKSFKEKKKKSVFHLSFSYLWSCLVQCQAWSYGRKEKDLFGDLLSVILCAFNIVRVVSSI